MRPADRLFQIVLQLGRGRVVTAKTLSERLEVSERTIYRDIKSLMASGVPIEGEAGVGYAAVDLVVEKARLAWAMRCAAVTSCRP